MGTTGAATDRLLGRFVDAVTRVAPVNAVWAHGSLAAGDYQEGRSDLDLVALVGGDPATSRTALEGVHRRLIPADPLAANLHCAYVARMALADPRHPHLTWAHRRMQDRPLSEVSRRELATGLTLAGPRPAEVVPPVDDAALRAFIRDDLIGFWRPATAHRRRWLRDIWVDLGLLTVARAHVTLREGRLITKREALDVLAALDAPAEVVEDIRTRRYGPPRRPSWRWRVRRAGPARAFVRAGVDRALDGV